MFMSSVFSSISSMLIFFKNFSRLVRSNLGLRSNTLNSFKNFRTINLSSSIIMSDDSNKKLKREVLKIGTHSGTFHCDEVLACFMLHHVNKYKNAEIIRSRDLDVLKTCDIVVDVGDVFNPDENRFDHHHQSFNETLSALRPELGDSYDIRLSSAGLIYTYFGEEVITNILKKHSDLELPKNLLRIIYKKVYETFIREIDGIDNGVQVCDGEPRYHITTHISARVGKLNPQWNSTKTISEKVQFEKAMSLAGEEFLDKILYYGNTWLPARNIVKAALEQAKTVHDSGEILELPEFCPWKEHLFDLEKEMDITKLPKYVLFCDRVDNWRVVAIPRKPDSFICRKFLHKDWRGLRATDIQEASGIADSIFCHATGFIGGASSRNGVFQMAVKSLEANFVD